MTVCAWTLAAAARLKYKCDNTRAFLLITQGTNMQFNQLISAAMTAVLALSLSVNAAAADNGVKGKGKTKVYDEQTFLGAFSGKSRKQVSETLGAPVKKEQSVKPSNADSVVAGVGKTDNSKPVNVEMWYYNNNVTYDGKRTYKTTEITFVNDRVQNIGFINSK